MSLLDRLRGGRRFEYDHPAERLLALVSLDDRRAPVRRRAQLRGRRRGRRVCARPQGPRVQAVRRRQRLLRQGPLPHVPEHGAARRGGPRRLRRGRRRARASPRRALVPAAPAGLPAVSPPAAARLPPARQGARPAAQAQGGRRLLPVVHRAGDDLLGAAAHVVHRRPARPLPLDRLRLGRARRPARLPLAGLRPHAAAARHLAVRRHLRHLPRLPPARPPASGELRRRRPLWAACGDAGQPRDYVCLRSERLPAHLQRVALRGVRRRRRRRGGARPAAVVCLLPARRPERPMLRERRARDGRARRARLDGHLADWRRRAIRSAAARRPPSAARRHTDAAHACDRVPPPRLPAWLLLLGDDRARAADGHHRLGGADP
mmetsp:Transcript_73208/g.219872  ORF Transcript_73208/g.219872 Transcript_73208/m.219872 type:complete len:377 (+) Transcript_73208:416-1546(+)